MTIDKPAGGRKMATKRAIRAAIHPVLKAL
jgi:hypothetical protein